MILVGARDNNTSGFGIIIRVKDYVALPKNYDVKYFKKIKIKEEQLQKKEKEFLQYYFNMLRKPCNTKTKFVSHFITAAHHTLSMLFQIYKGHGSIIGNYHNRGPYREKFLQ